MDQTMTLRKKSDRPFSKILRGLMAEKKITVREAAKMAGVAVSTLDDWRGGAVPEDYLAVKKLAQSLGVSMAFLLTGEDEASSNSVSPSVTEVFQDGGALFDGFAKITIQRLIPRNKKDSS